MSQELTSKSDSIVTRLRALSARAEVRINETEKAMVRRDQISAEIRKAVANQQVVDRALHNIKETLKDVKEYSAERFHKSMTSIYSALYAARSIIPDTTSLELKVTPKEAWLTNADGQVIELLEGSGFSALVSLLIRRVILTNTEYEPFILLDEPLAVLSPENSAEFSQYLPLLGENMQIILIEQKPEVFSSSDPMVYEFVKSEGVTKVRRTSLD